MLYENPDLYDTLLPVSAQQLHFYVALAQRQAGPVLALACGSGQVVVPIAANGLAATGLDASKPMLAAAERRAKAANATVRLVHGDMRDFDLGQRFSLIFVARNSLLHLHEPHELTGFFAAVRRHLQPNGVLAFDVFNPDPRLLSRPAGQRFGVMEVVSPAYGKITVESTNDYDRCSQVNRATWFISTPEKRDAWVAPLHLRSIFPQELPLLVAAHGFRLARRDGDFSGGSFTSASASQVCQCEAVA
jgi:SAM-dependent methyltransferase